MNDKFHCCTADVQTTTVISKQPWGQHRGVCALIMYDILLHMMLLLCREGLGVVH